VAPQCALVEERLEPSFNRVLRLGDDRGMEPSSAAVEVVVERLARLPGRSPTLVCLEGLGGAGKSTLSAAVVAASLGDIVVVHGDDFYGPEQADWRSWSPEEGYERYFDHERLEHQLLRTLKSATPARFQTYNWTTNALDGWTTVAPQGIVLVEGVYLLRSRLRDYWDFAIYVDTPRDLRQDRLFARGENDDGWISSWAAAEDYYERLECPAAAADLVVKGF
jgi:uridine kinase